MTLTAMLAAVSPLATTVSVRMSPDWVGRLAVCAAMDLALALAAVFLMAMAVAPVLGI